MNRFNITDHQAQWLASIVVDQDGLVLIYGGPRGTYGCSFSTQSGADISTILRGVDEYRVADGFMKHVDQHNFFAKRSSEEFIRLVWPKFIRLLGGSTVGRSPQETVLAEIKALHGHARVPSLVQKLVADHGLTKPEAFKILLSMKDGGSIRLSLVGRGNYDDSDLEWCPLCPETGWWWGHVYTEYAR